MSDLKAGDVVWAKTESGFPNWPCKVLEISDQMKYTLQSFGDDIIYEKEAVDLFECSSLTKGRKSLKRRPDTLKLYELAVNNAVKYMQTINPNFQLEDSDAITFTQFGSTHSAAINTATPTLLTSTPITEHKTNQRKRTRDNNKVETDVEHHQPKRECTRIDNSQQQYIELGKDQQSATTTELDKVPNPMQSAKDNEQDNKKRHSDFESNNSSTIASDCSNSEDDLPCVSFTEKNWSVADVKGNDIIWAKYQRYPHWPALVDTINNKNRRIKVFFLGWPDKMSIPMSYRKKENFAAYNYQNTEKFKREGHNEFKNDSQMLLFFKLAIEEAEKLKKLRADKDIGGTPIDQFRTISQQRPSSFYQQSASSSKQSIYEERTSTLSNEEDSVQKELWGGDNDESDIEGDSNVDDDNEDTSSPYCFSKVQEQFYKLRPVLESICTGNTDSDLHQMYTTAPSNERSGMKYLEKFGPANSLHHSKKTELVDYLLNITEKITGDNMHFQYAYDVLLPEAMARTISNIEGCTVEEAWKRYFFNN